MLLVYRAWHIYILYTVEILSVPTIVWHLWRVDGGTRRLDCFVDVLIKVNPQSHGLSQIQVCVVKADVVAVARTIANAATNH